MLSIKTNKYNLVVSPNIKVVITAINPLLVRSRGSNSLNFGLPAINGKYLGAPQEPGIKRVNSVPVNVSFDSYKKSVQMLYESLSDKQLACRINIDETQFYELYRDSNIRDLELGGTRQLTVPYYYTSDTSDFVVVAIINNSFLNGTMHEAAYVAGVKNQNNLNFDIPLLTPFVFLCYLYEQLFIEKGYTVVYNFLREDSHFKKLALYTNQSTSGSENAFNLAEHLPDLTFSKFINAVSDLLNVHPVINETTKEVFIISLEQKIKASKIVDITQYADDDLSKLSEELAQKIVFKIGVDTSDSKQNPHKYLSEQQNINIQGPVAQVANLPADPAGTIRLVTDTNWYYRREVDTAGVYTWQKYSKNIQEVVFGAGEKQQEIKSDIAAVQSLSTDNYCEVDMEGNTIYRMEPKKIPFMLGFVHNANGDWGLWNNSGEANELFLSPESIFNYCFKNTANMLVNSYTPYECTLRFPPALLNNFDFSAIYQIRNTPFLVENLNYNLEAKKITYDKSKLRAL